MKLIKQVRKGRGLEATCVQVRSDNYGSSLEHILKMASELKKDFPDLSDDDISVNKYGGERIKGIMFVETFLTNRTYIPMDYKETDTIEYIL